MSSSAAIVARTGTHGAPAPPADPEALRDYMKARVKELGIASVRVNSAGCLDRCELGPCVVIYPDGVWYRLRTRADVDRMIEAHLAADGRAPELILPSPAPASSPSF